MSPPRHPLPSATGAPPEKSKFLQTCNRLSQFLKEKGKIKELNAKFDATGAGLCNSVKSLYPNSTCQPDTGASDPQPTTVDLLSSIGEKTEKPKTAEYVILDSSTCEPKPAEDKVTKHKSCAQMTIFYQGQVLVLDEVPEHRARELMLIARKGVETSKHQPVVDVCRSKEKEPMKAEVQQGKDSELPIARRASLHKFLAKRKDRATVRAPYQSPGGSSSGNEHSFDLNL